MADVFKDRQDTVLGHILLPGAFNSTSYACDVANGISPDAPAVVRAFWGEEDNTENEANRQRVVDWATMQDRRLAQQLEDGIRFIEINVTMKEGIITTWHSVYGVPIDEVLDDIVSFAVTWPDEIVLITLGLTMDTADWPLLGDALTTPRQNGLSFCDLVYNGANDIALTPLTEIHTQGRNLIWSPEGDLRTYLETRGDCPLSHGLIDRYWSLTITPEGVATALEASLSTRDPQHMLINDFVFSLDGAASPFDQANYILGYAGVKEASQALGFSGDFPGRLISTYDTEAKINVLAGAYYEDTNLVEAAIAENRLR